MEQAWSEEVPAECEICRICGGSATGLHYGVITCEGCKVFFKRYMGKHEQYRCYFGGHCVINLQTRSRCKACRFKKCVDQGMSVEAIRLGRTPKIVKTARAADLRSCHGSFGRPTAAAAKAAPPVPLSSYSPVPELMETDDSLEDEKPTSPLEIIITTTPFKYPFAEISLDLVHGNQENEDCSCPTGTDLAHYTSQQGSALLTFADENLSFMLNDFLGDFIRPCHVPEMGLPGVESCRAELEPSTMQRYWSVMQTRCSVLTDSIKAVSDAMISAFGGHIRVTLEAVENWYTQGLIQYQPQCSLKEMLFHIQSSVDTHAQKLIRFVNLVPGFVELGEKDRISLVRDRWSVSWLIAWAYCYRENECYYPMGPYRYQYCRYWMDQMMGPHFLRFLFSFTEDVNTLQLNLTETYMLLVVSVFKIDTADAVEEKGLIDFLYCHYLDALIHMLGPSRAYILPKLHKLIRRFSIVHEVHRRYILNANVEESHLSKMGDSEDAYTVVHLDPNRFTRSDFQPPATFSC